MLLALLDRARTGKGRKIDVSMTDNLFTFMYWAMADGLVGGRWPAGGDSRVTGGWPRYQVYRTKDGQFVAAAPLEQRFWDVFCDIVDLPAALRDDRKDPAGSTRAVADLIARRTAEEWRAAFAGRDCCSVIVARLKDAMADPHFVARGLFERGVVDDMGRRIPAVPTAVDRGMLATPDETGYPALGQDNALLDR
ncbi:MAG: CoA transferase [Alphaproteobacteria bacterium]